ncbi:hypothetical protein [Eikenella corrodens]|uniref:Lipoprotein n=1 Tax=Eikenella corrodens TaxID=539 RepID=A0A3S9SHV9_EIKCO|nr:hypothetical protein [Eikenella corrodens]AZR59125.1 hypothetical protein ELB75_03200 [Eikenella corrodens]
MLIRHLFPAVLVLAACQTTGSNPANQVPTTPRSSFVNACADNAASWQMTPNQAAGVCACAYDRVSSRYGHNWIRQPANPNTPLGRYFISSVRQCAARPNANPNRRSISSHRSAFLDLCTSRNTGITPAQTRRICACTYDTLRSRYTTAQWQQHINNDTSLDRDPVLKRRINEAANTCVRRHFAR